MRVAVTRPEPQADGTARRLETLGHSVVRAPLLAARVHDPGSPDGFASLVLTSRAAALALAPHPAFHRLPAYCVGDATAAEAARAGLTVAVSAAGDVDALLPVLAGAPEPILHLAGTDHAGALVERLLAAGRRAERRVVYTMAPLPLPQVGAVDAVLLYSPRTAALFAAAAAGPWRDATAVALSPAVAAPVAAWRTVVAARPDEDALLAALATLQVLSQS